MEARASNTMDDFDDSLDNLDDELDDDLDDGPDIVLETQELSRSYGPVVALDRLDLVLREGECMALMGPNGSGKTTAAELICGLQEPTLGWARVRGHSVHQEPDAIAARRELAFVPDTPLLYGDLTVLDHLRLVAAAHGAADEGFLERADHLLELLDLTERSTFFPPQLSRGMRQKTALACALIRPYSLLVLDEPIIGLDARSVEALAGVIRQAIAAGQAVLLLTHSDAFAAEVATRSLRIEEGKLVDHQ